MRRLLIIASFFCAGLSAWGQATYRYWFDRDETAMQTGTFTDNHLQLDIPTDGLSDWYHILHIQTQDDAGNWSAVVSRSFAVVPVSTAGNLDLSRQAYRYWFDRDEAGMKTGTLSGNNLVVDIPTDGLSDWYHILHIQTQDDTGNWSPVISRSFAIVPASTAGSRDLTGQTYRYWFDRDEAGMKTGTLSGNNLVVDIPTDGLSDWYHILHIQTQDDAGNWSPVISRSFAIVPASTAGSRDLTGQPSQYWFDDNFDVAVEGTMTGNVLQLDAVTDNLAAGIHVLNLRTRDDAGNWSAVVSRKFSVGGNYGDIVPWGQDEPWEATYLYYNEDSFTEPASDADGHHWTELAFDDSAWQTLTGPMATPGLQESGLTSYHYEVANEGEYLLRRKFTLDELSVGRYYFNAIHDDGAYIYVNGHIILEGGEFGNRKVEIPSSVLVQGENIIALHYFTFGYPNYLDYSIFCEPVSSFNLQVSASGNGKVKLLGSEVRETTSTIQATPKADVVIAITPDYGNFIESVLLDDVDVTNQVVDGKLTLSNLLDDHNLVVTFGNNEAQATVILPKGIDEAWQMRYVFTENFDEYVEPSNDAAGHTWKDLEYDDSAWQTLTGPMGTNVAVSNFEWGGDNNCFNLRRKFTIDEITQSRYILQMMNDDHVQVYLNGHLIMQMMDDWSHEQYLSYAIPSSAFVEGENILAIWIYQNSGGTALDYSLISIPLSPSDYTFTSEDGLQYHLDHQNCMAMVSGLDTPEVTSVTIPSTVHIANTWWPVNGFLPGALSAATALESVEVQVPTPYAIPADCFSSETFASATLLVPTTSLDAYKQTASWSSFDQIVPCTEGTLVPWGYEQPWTARYLFFEHVSDFAEPEADRDGHVWSDETFDDSAWQSLTGPMANNDQFPVVNHTAMGENSAWLLRRTFHVNRLPLGAIHLNVMHDDDIRTYVNGTEIDANSGTTVPRSLIHEGDNTIAFYYHVITPPDYIDYTLDYLGFLPQEGDANNDATIDLGDLVQIVSHITGTTPSHFNLSMADVNKDGEVNAADLVALVSLMMGEGTEIAPARLPSLQTEANDVLTGYITADGRLCFDLQAETAYTACQLTLSLPAGADIKDVRLAAERSGGHVVTMGRREDGRVVVLVYSTANKPFQSQNGLFFEGVAQMANNGSIDVEDILFVTPKGTVRHFDSFSIDLAAGVASVKQGQHSDAPTYDLAGRRVGQSLKKGIYIQKGRKKLK